MKKVYIKHNPYKLETKITVDGKELAQNSEIREKALKTPDADSAPRLQEWIEEFPKMLNEEYHDDFEITFYGTLLDYEDLESVFAEERKRGTVIIKHEPAKETLDKEVLIDKVFRKIGQGPFEELKDAQIISSFQQAMSEDFEVCVVATMSAGKSTLINAMLCEKLMPSKNTACTATITRIKDISNDNIPFRAEVYDKENHLKETYNDLNLHIMERQNSDTNVSAIKVFGNIPFVSTDDVSLVFIDTPGPTYALNPHHREVFDKLMNTSSKTLVLYITTGDKFGTDSDNELLERVAKSMSVGGKQSKDRFIFVVNKADDFKSDCDGSIKEVLDKMRGYLKNNFGIVKPKLFPTAADMALNIRLADKNIELNANARIAMNGNIEIFNQTPMLHLEEYTLHMNEYAALPASISSEINKQLVEARKRFNGSENKNQNEALIHTGVVSIEAAIRQYVQKYAKTAKIKNIVDTFAYKLDEFGCFEEAKRELAKNRDDSVEIAGQIASIRKKIDIVKDTKEYKDTVKDAVDKVNNNSKDVIDDIIQQFQSRITKRIDSLRNREIVLDDVEKEVEQLIEFANKLELDFVKELEKLISANLEGVCNELLKGYKKKLASLTEEVGGKNFNAITIDPLKLMRGSIRYGDFSITATALQKEKKVADGYEESQEYVENTDKAWYKPWTWFQEDGYYRTVLNEKYKKIKYVDGSELARVYYNPVEKYLSNNGDAVREYAREQSKKMAESFDKEFNRLDQVLKMKLTELENFLTDKGKIDDRLKDSEKKLKWLNDIKIEVESILEI